jgi:hypothetical protein
VVLLYVWDDCQSIKSQSLLYIKPDTLMDEEVIPITARTEADRSRRGSIFATANLVSNQTEGCQNNRIALAKHCQSSKRAPALCLHPYVGRVVQPLSSETWDAIEKTTSILAGALLTLPDVEKAPSSKANSGTHPQLKHVLSRQADFQITPLRFHILSS